MGLVEGSNWGEWYESTAAEGVLGNRFCCTSIQEEGDATQPQATYIPQELAKVAKNYPQIVHSCV